MKPIGFYLAGASGDVEGPALCRPCHFDQHASNDDRCSPIFAFGDSVDSPEHCDECRVLIPVSLTEDGERYVVDHVNRHDGDPAVLREWIEGFGYLFPGWDEAPDDSHARMEAAL